MIIAPRVSYVILYMFHILIHQYVLIHILRSWSVLPIVERILEPYNSLHQLAIHTKSIAFVNCIFLPSIQILILIVRVN